MASNDNKTKTTRNVRAGVKVTSQTTAAGPAAYLVSGVPMGPLLLSAPTLIGWQDSTVAAALSYLPPTPCASFPHGAQPTVIVVETFDGDPPPPVLVMHKRAENGAARGRAGEAYRLALRLDGAAAAPFFASEGSSGDVARLRTVRTRDDVPNPAHGSLVTLRARHILPTLRILSAGAAAVGMAPADVPSERVSAALRSIGAPAGAVWACEAAPSEVAEAAREAVKLGLFASEASARKTIGSAIVSLGVNVYGYTDDDDDNDADNGE